MNRKPKVSRKESKAALDAQAPSKSQALATLKSDKPAFRPQAVPLNKYADSDSLNFKPAEEMVGVPCYVSGSRIQKGAIEAGEGRIYFELRPLADLQTPVYVSLNLFTGNGEIQSSRMSLHNQVTEAAENGGCVGPVMIERVEMRNGGAFFSFEPIEDEAIVEDDKQAAKRGRKAKQEDIPF